MNKNKVPDRKAKKVGEVLAVLMVFFTFTSMAVALDFKYPAKIERVIDGDTIIADLRLGLGVILADRQSEPDIELAINDLRRAHFSRIKEKDQIRVERLKKFKEG